MPEEKEFQPDWVSPPGETIAQVLKRRHLSSTEFGKAIGRGPDQVDQLLSGVESITIETARKLESVLGGSVTFWMIRESQYRFDQARLATDVVPDSQEQWLRDLPLSEMRKFGWTEPLSGSHILEECLRFFGVPDFETWHGRYGTLLRQAAFKTSGSFPTNPSATAAWLRQAEIQAELIECAPWNAGRFREELSAIRQLTRNKDPIFFLPELRRRCAECGVALVILRAPTGCRASGATRLLSPQKALLLLSFRYLSDDHFWFAFFHEAGHLILHDPNALFLEDPETSPARLEEEANKFAADILIPERFRNETLNLPVNGFEVMRFAKRIGVSPGIVIGQLQHVGHFTHRQLNNLKRRFRWVPNDNGSI